MFKRIYYLLFLALLLLFCGCGAIRTLYIGALESVHILVPEEYALGGDRYVWITEPNEIMTAATALKSGEVAASRGVGLPYIITLNYQRATEEYEVYINGNAMFFTFENNAYAATAENANAFLAFPAFTGRYIAPLLNSIAVKSGNELFYLWPESYSISVFTPSGQKNAAATVEIDVTTPLVIDNLESISISEIPAGAELEIAYLDANGEQVDEPQEAGMYACVAQVSLVSGDVSGSLSYRFDFAYEPPLSAIISADNAEQSGSFAVLLNNTGQDATYALRAGFREDEIIFSSLGKSMQIALIAVDAAQKPGEYRLEVLADSVVIESFSVIIENRDFPKQYLTVSAEQAVMRSDPANAASDARKTATAKANPEPALLCDGSFIMPCEARISTEFGEERYINGVFSNRHSGLDIAAKEDTPVLATTRGKVVFADELIISGNTVIIDHGAGMFSSYCHLNGFACELDNIVEQGDTVGFVGSTGFSTGPHLHWSISLHGTNINPLALVENSQLLAVIER